MTEQNGIDILCDAAGSDMILNSFFSLGTPAATAHSPAEASPHQQAKRVKLSEGSIASSPAHKATHVCYICKRVYERADHLTRHLRSHENARQYQCSRCPKRFNRAYVVFLPPPPLRPLMTPASAASGSAQPTDHLLILALETCLPVMNRLMTVM
jgi:hypothetical protein